MNSLVVDPRGATVSDLAATTGPASTAIAFDVRRLPLWRPTEMSPSDYDSFEVAMPRRRRDAIRWDVVLDTALLTLALAITVGGLL